MEDAPIAAGALWSCRPSCRPVVLHTDGVTDGADGSTSWLELLSDERSPSELEQFRRQQLDGSKVRERDRVEREAARALRIRAALEERKQDADQLAVLNDLARRLASLRETGEVLQEVAQQARRLLAVDVAYLMRLHADGQLVIDVVDGSMGSALRGIVLNPGSGLGGEVLRTGRPMWSENYLADRAFAHVETVDRAAESEQLGGILGVPLVLGEETIGVLLAAERHPRRFAGREVELLAALASHAAVAIHNADLFAQAHAATSELRQTNAALQHTNEMRQQANDLRDQLTEEIIRGGGFTEVVALLERQLGSAVAVFSENHHLLAGDRGVWDPATASELPATVQRIDTVDGYAVAAPVLLRSGYAGSLVASSPQPFEDETVRLLSIGATAVALVVASEHSAAEAERRARGEFLHALLAPDADDTSIRRRAARSNIRLDEISAVIVLDPGSEDGSGASRLASRLVTDTTGVAAEHGDHVVVLLSGVDATDARRRLAVLHPDPLPCAVGVAPCDGGVRGVRAAHEAARQTATVLIALGREHDCAVAAELGVYRSLFSQAGRAQIASFVDLTIGPLLRYDADRGRDLARTLAIYLQSWRHHAGTCAELHIHANTLYQRLERIGDLLGTTWSDPGRSLEIQLALRLHELLLSLPQH